MLLLSDKKFSRIKLICIGKYKKYSSNNIYLYFTDKKNNVTN